MRYIAYNISEQDYIEAARAVALYGWGNDINDQKSNVARLTKDERNDLKRKLSIVSRVQKELSKQLKQAEVDATDWQKIIKEAKKRFTWLDIAILKTLLDGESEYYMSYAGIEYSLPDHLPEKQPMPIKGRHTIRLRTRRLMRMGLVSFHKGLFTDDGEVAGSGFGIGRYETVKNIIMVYETKQEELGV